MVLFSASSLSFAVPLQLASTEVLLILILHNDDSDNLVADVAKDEDGFSSSTAIKLLVVLSGIVPDSLCLDLDTDGATPT